MQGATGSFTLVGMLLALKRSICTTLKPNFIATVEHHVVRARSWFSQSRILLKVALTDVVVEVAMLSKAHERLGQAEVVFALGAPEAGLGELCSRHFTLSVPSVAYQLRSWCTPSLKDAWVRDSGLLIAQHGAACPKLQNLTIMA
eukprot:2905787-Amphidinium_carterae.2